MTTPKRHHWWPIAQSRYWVNDEEKVYVSRSDGSHFQANPLNIGVESELYTIFEGEASKKDVSIEHWFSAEIDGRIKNVLDFFHDESKIIRRPDLDRQKEKEKMESLGFIMRKYISYYNIQESIRWDIAFYIASLLVRHPNYIKKLTEYNLNHGVDGFDAKNNALYNMGSLIEIYSNKIYESTFILTRHDGNGEYLFSDGGITVKEPWDPGHVIPFDIHAPLTPRLALQVFPIKREWHIPFFTVFQVNKKMLGMQNRIALADASRFVFSQYLPPSDFVRRYFGAPAPAVHGYRVVDGKFETTYDPRQ